MATVSGGTVVALNFDLLQVGDLFDYAFSQTSATSARYFDDAANFTLFQGTALTFNANDEPLGGMFTSVRHVVGGDLVLLITGGSVAAKTLYNHAIANDTLGLLTVALKGNDTENGTPFADTLQGFAGNDTIAGAAGADDLDGGLGNDVVKGGAGADFIEGGQGFDTADYSDKTAAVQVVLKGNTIVTVKVGTANEDSIRGVENVTGGSTGDALAGDGLINVLTGNGGNDSLSGNGADDALIGGFGNDLLRGGAGRDLLDGGNGVDTADLSEKLAAVAVTLKGATSVALRVGGVVEDAVQNVENVRGGRVNDLLIGDGFGNILEGNYGDDRLRGEAGSDTLEGGAGTDRLTGGLGLDTLDGGAGDDSFIYTALADSGIAAATRDRIVGFASGDRIDLRPIDAIAGGTDDAFTLDTGGSFSAGEIHQKFTGGNLLVEFNADADADVEMSLLLIARATLLAAADFNL